MELNNIIKRPLITEKTVALTADSKYTFVVSLKTTKRNIKKAVEQLFKVNVQKVWLITVAGKKKRVGRFKRTIKQKTDWKKAIVQLNKGQKIELFETTKKA